MNRYPYYQDRTRILEQAHCISTAFANLLDFHFTHTFTRSLADREHAPIPIAFLPPGGDERFFKKTRPGGHCTSGRTMGTTTLADATASFLLMGVQVGDKVAVLNMGHPAQGEYVVKDILNPTTLMLDRVVAANTCDPNHRCATGIACTNGVCEDNLDYKILQDAPPLLCEYDPNQARGQEMAAACQGTRQWAIRPSGPIDPFGTGPNAGSRDSFPDPHATYLLAPIYTPFGAKVVIEGSFPRSRFFNIQVTPAFKPENYIYDESSGTAEVPIVDVDIDPLPGSTNPFRLGANRNVPLDQRDYRVEFTMTEGDPVVLNQGAFSHPNYRAPGNHRYGGAIHYQGPWADDSPDPKTGKDYGHKRGMWSKGFVWIRIYVPDDGCDALGCVPLPRIYYEYNGRTFWLQFDMEALVRFSEVDQSVPADYRFNGSFWWTGHPANPPAGFTSGPDYGWTKQFSIRQAIVGGLTAVLGNGRETNNHAALSDYIYQLSKGSEGKDEFAPPSEAPRNTERSATDFSYASYLLRGMTVEPGRVAVVTGKLPRFPATRSGAATMAGGDMRYWSLTAYWAHPFAIFVSPWNYCEPGETQPCGRTGYAVGLPLHSIMDEDLVLDQDRHYVLALSRAEDRPVNATTAAGVTWFEWGPSPIVSWTLRWVTVNPDWDSATQNLKHVGWAANYFSPTYDPTLLPNGHGGVLGDHLPRISYLSKGEFEALGSPVRHNHVPAWKYEAACMDLSDDDGDGKVDCTDEDCQVSANCKACGNWSVDNNETDVDCGGSCSNRCANLKRCTVAGDCQSRVCTNGICQTPVCVDGVKNGNETGRDCGGDCEVGCPAGEGCLDMDDCASGRCVWWVCQ